MPKVKPFLLPTIIGLQIVAIIGVASYIVGKYSDNLTASISLTDRNSLAFQSTSTLKHFYEPKPNTLGKNKEPKWLKFVPQYTINGDSLNERFDYSLEKPDSTFRIITLGDSFTYGLFVNTSENYPEVLEDILNKRKPCSKYKKYEVINLGMTGYDIQYSAERFKLRGEKYNPDLIVWFIKWDDVDSPSEYIISTAESKMKMVENQNKPIEEVWGEAAEELFEEFNPTSIENFQNESFSSINKYFKKNILVYSPLFTLESKLISSRSIIKNFAQLRPNTYVYESKINKPNILFPDNHPNVAGHQLIASDLYDYIIEHNLISCK